MNFSERVVHFGGGGALLGVLCEPPKGRRIVGAPAVLFWNVGINHHVGPYRIFVDLARRLARAGFSSMRFDVSGLGDSEFTREDSRPDEERAVGDVREAIEVCARLRGFEKFVLIGFCSSVDTAHALALKEPSVAGVVYLEGYYYKTRGYYMRYPLRFFDPNRWVRRLRNRYERLFGALGPAVPEQEQVFLRNYPSPDALRKELRTLIERGTRLLFVYVAGDSKYAHRDQFFEFTGGREFEGRVELEFWPDADHLFFLTRDRLRVLERIERYLLENFVPSGEGRARIADDQNYDARMTRQAMEGAG